MYSQTDDDEKYHEDAMKRIFEHIITSTQRERKEEARLRRKNTVFFALNYVNNIFVMIGLVSYCFHNCHFSLGLPRKAARRAARGPVMTCEAIK